MKVLPKTLLLAAAGMLVAAAPAAAADHESQFDGSLAPLNGSGSMSSAMVWVEGTSLTVEISGTGFVPGAPHAQHLHGDASGMAFECPTAADVERLDEDGDGLLNTLEAAVMYGGVMVSLTTEGDTSGDSALAVDRFPVADDNGNIEYSRTFEVSQDVADSLENLHIVQHGVDLNGNGEYDGEARSSLDDSLPLEATLPATCGELGAAQTAMTPEGGVQTGNALGESNSVLLVSGLALAAAAGAGALAVRARRPIADK